MRQGLLKNAPASLKSACECLEPAEAPIGCKIDKEKVSSAGLSRQDLKSCAVFLADASCQGEAALTRMLTKLLGPDWDRYFSGKSTDDRSVAELFVSRAALAMIMASGKKLGVIGGRR